MMRFKKGIGKLHLWLGLASGLLVFFVSITGCIFVFEQEIFHLVHRDMVMVDIPAGSTPRPLSELKAAAQAALGSDLPVTAITIFPETDLAYAFTASQYDMNRKGWFYDATWVHRVNAWVDLYTGRVTGVMDMRREFFVLIRQLHQFLGLRREIGSPIVGSAVLVFLFMLVSGMVLWWPRSRAALNARLKVSWRSRWKRLNWDLHSVLGFYVLSVALIIVVTGLTWSFEWWRNGILAALGSGKPDYSTPAVKRMDPTGEAPLDVAIREIMGRRPSTIRMILSGVDNETVMKAYVHWRGGTAWRESDFNFFDSRSGREFARRNHEDKPLGMKWSDSVYDFHVGNALGLPGQILAFLASLVCATLPVSGFFVWWNKRRKSTPKAGPMGLAGRDRRNPAMPAPEPSMQAAKVL